MFVNVLISILNIAVLLPVSVRQIHTILPRLCFNNDKYFRLMINKKQ